MLCLAGKFYTKHNPEGLPHFHCGPEDLRDLLLNMSSTVDSATIILEGLDECGANTAQVTELLVELTSAQQSTIKLFILSRRIIEIEQHLAEFPSLSIAAKSADLKLYIGAEIERRSQLSNHQKIRIRDPKLEEEVMDRLVNEADGMFRYVAYQSWSNAPFTPVRVQSLVVYVKHSWVERNRHRQIHNQPGWCVKFCVKSN